MRGGGRRRGNRLMTTGAKKNQSINQKQAVSTIGKHVAVSGSVSESGIRDAGSRDGSKDE